MSRDGAILAQAVSDEEDRLTSADEPIASLQIRCGGELPGTIAVPALLETVRKARRYQLKLARSISAQSGGESITAWVEAEPREDGAMGCDIRVRSWNATPLPEKSSAAELAERETVDRHVAELQAVLDPQQRVLAVEATAPDLQGLADAMRKGQGKAWTEFVELPGAGHVQPMHWRLLDGAKVAVEGSDRDWRAVVIPRNDSGSEAGGFELLLVADVPLPGEDAPVPDPGKAGTANGSGLVGQEIAPVLRQPIARIIANAETIRTRLAGPIADEYANYAAEIAVAGEHLLGLLDDLADLEVVEAENFTTQPDAIDLAEIARQAAGILGVRSKERDITIDLPKQGESLPAIGEFRRVMQVLLNLIGNAIAYSPEGSQVWIRLAAIGDRARIIVADQGPGLSEEDAAKVFEKFERLGRGNDGGTGLGLYISRRLAEAMGGELSVESAPGQGARFMLDLPYAPANEG